MPGPGPAVHAGSRSGRERGRRTEEARVPEELRISEVPGDVASVVDQLTAALRARGIEIFATVDHAAGARAAGLELADEVLLVFGNPAVGTALMQADPRCGLDLPLRMLVWSQDGTTRVAHH